MAFPVVDCRIAWNGSFGASGGANDISKDILAATVTKGTVDFAGGDQPGQATLTVRNESGKYNDLISTAFAGNLKPYKLAHINVIYGGTTYGFFDGYVENVVPSTGGGDRTAEITLIDHMARWRTKQVSVTQADRSYKALRTAILDAGGVGANVQRQLTDDVEGSFVNAVGVSRMDMLSALAKVNQATGSRHFIAPLPSFANPTAAYIVRHRNYSVDVNAAGPYAAGYDFTRVDSWSGLAGTLVNEQTVVPSARVYDTSRTDVWTGNVPISIPASSSVTIWADLDVPAKSVAAAYTGTNIASVVVTGFDTSAKIVITATASAGTITALSLNGFAGRVLSVASGFSEDTASKAIYDVVQGAEISNDWIPSTALAQGLAEHYVWRFADPKRRAVLLYENAFPQMFAGNSGVDPLMFDNVQIIDYNPSDPTIPAGGIGLANWSGEIIADQYTIDVAGERWTLRRTLQEAPTIGGVGLWTLETNSLDELSGFLGR